MEEIKNSLRSETPGAVLNGKELGVMARLIGLHNYETN
jgi:hypothetical protein